MLTEEKRPVLLNKGGPSRVNRGEEVGTVE